MPKTQKQVKSCHDCGLEAVDDCETEKRHIPADENLTPCCYCIRNPEKHKLKTLWRADFYAEMWTREADKSPLLEDPDPHERRLLQTLHEIVQKEYRRLPVPRRC